MVIIKWCGPGEVSRYSDSLRDGNVRGSSPGGARLSASVHTGRGAHAASYKMDTGSRFGW
jgi:hypothetical protein